MAEFIYTAPEPTVIGTFSHEKAQAFAEDFTADKDIGSTPDIHIGAKYLEDFDMDIFGMESHRQDAFVAYSSPYIEFLSYVLKNKSYPNPGVNMWHADTLVDTRQPQPTFTLVPVTIGSSSHSTEIVCGDVVFKHDIRKSRYNRNYLSAEAGQRAIDLAIQKGDAWIYEPEDGVLDGKIMEFRDANLHRRRQSDPVSPVRLVIRPLSKILDKM